MSEPAEKLQTNDRPSVLAGCVAEIDRYLVAGRNLPPRMPQNSHAAAAWFIDYFRENEPIVVHYVIRLLRKFMHLPTREQEYVVAAREDGVYWRGEDMDMFKRIVDETVKYKALSPEGKLEYRKECKRKLGNVGGAL